MLRHARRHRWSGRPRPPCPPRPLSLEGKASRRGGGGQGALWAAGGAGGSAGARHGRLLTSIPTAARQKADAGQQTGSCARPLPTSPPGPQPALTFPALKPLRPAERLGAVLRAGAEARPTPWLEGGAALRGGERVPKRRPGGPGGPTPGFCCRDPTRPPGALSAPSSAETRFSLGLPVQSPTWPRNGEKRGAA